MDAEERNNPVILVKEPSGGVPNVIDTIEDYQKACEQLDKSVGPVAVDAERASGFRYNHGHCLIQCKRKNTPIMLFDVLSLNEAGVHWKDFHTVLSTATWILHDARQDLPGFVELSMTPTSLFDTSIAAQILGLKHFGLAAVLSECLGKTLTKEHSAADWSYRPLPRTWRNYAALDVDLLLELQEHMEKALESEGKLSWAREEFNWILHNYLQPSQRPQEGWKHLPQLATLSHDKRALAIARELFNQRETLAQNYDIEPSLLLSDQAIMQAAIIKPRGMHQFKSLRILHERVRMHVGEERGKMFERYAPIQRSVKPRVWKDAIDKALHLPYAQLPTLTSSAKRQSEESSHGPKSCVNGSCVIQNAMRSFRKLERQSINFPKMFMYFHN